MKRLLSAAALAACTLPAAAAVGVSVNIGQPGFYGQINIGDAPPPQLVYAQPVVIQPVPVGVVEQPLYLRVPPGHAKNWAKHCRHYNACGRPVYFVRDDWYNNVYVPHYREHEDEYRRHGDDNDRGDHDDHGHGNGNGKGHGGGHGHGKGHGGD